MTVKLFHEVMLENGLKYTEVKNIIWKLFSKMDEIASYLFKYLNNNYPDILVGSLFYF